MAEAIMVVCDVCGAPAADTVRFRLGNRNLEKDFCRRHLDELAAGARAPRRGRRRAVVAPAPRRRGRPPKSTARAPSVGRGRPRKTIAKKR